MLTDEQKHDIGNYVRQILSSGIVDKKVGDTPLEAYDLVNKRYVDNSVAGVSAKVTTGVASRSLSASSGSQTIAHGLGKIPKFVRITGSYAGTTLVGFCSGTYDGTTMNYEYMGINSGAPSTANGGGNGNILVFTEAGGQAATITVDATNINLTWTKVIGGMSATAYFIWEVQ